MTIKIDQQRRRRLAISVAASSLQSVEWEVAGVHRSVQRGQLAY